jgi:RNA polymerase sigma factor (sigma-70 family)
MIPGKSGEMGRQLERLWAAGTLTGLSDAQLLRRFVDARGQDATGEAAFRELVNRHAAMVLGVCRQILRRGHDVDDAFQATFLVLVRKAPSIHVGDSIAPWLCSVAYRTAHRARADAAQYRSAGDVTLVEFAGPSPDNAFQFDLRPLLHEELNRLPDKFRDPIVLCHLEGKSHEEAARLLHWPVGTVSSRLSRGRQILRSRLEPRGVTAPLAIFEANWLAGTPTTIALPLLESTVNAAIGCAASQAVSAVVLSLTQGVLR